MREPDKAELPRPEHADKRMRAGRSDNDGKYTNQMEAQENCQHIRL